MKLNNKGMTIIEILVCFVIVSIIATSIYSLVSTFNNRKTEESYKQEIYKYKNLLTKEIYDDIIKKGLISVTNPNGGTLLAGTPEQVLGVSSCATYYPDTRSCTSGTVSMQNNGTRRPRVGLVQFRFNDNTIKILQVAIWKNVPSGDSYGNFDENYYISYGTPTDQIRYPLPNLGVSKTPSNKTLYDLTLSINKMTVANNVFHMDLRFYHPLLNEKYGINVTAPINMDSFDKS